MTYRPSAPTTDCPAPWLPITSTHHPRRHTMDRCQAAHHEDPTPCVGPHHAVLILDKDKSGAYGCEHHAARLLASLDGATVHTAPNGPKGAAIRVFKAADGLRPFCWYEAAPRTQPEALSRKENRERGDA